MRATRLAIVGTDLKFIRPLIPHFSSLGFDVRVDEWPKFRAHDLPNTLSALEWADTVICEWAGPNAVIATERKTPGQRLIVRLHRMELDHPYWREIDISAVDTVVTVGPYYRRKVLEITGWPSQKVIDIPNFVDSRLLDLPKAESAASVIGMIGASSSRKRLDLALDVLAQVRSMDASFTLHVKGADPWTSKWVQDRPEELEFFESIRSRLDHEPSLRESVRFDEPGNDVHEWLRNIGYVLSTSDDESFHLSPAEGMASRAVPLIRPWPGADEIYDREWVGPTTEMAERVVTYAANRGSWIDAGRRAHAESTVKFDIGHVAAIWARDALPHTDGPPGQMRIGIVSGSNAYKDPAVRALAHSLDSVGHSVVVISRGEVGDGFPPEIETPKIDPTPKPPLWRKFRHPKGPPSEPASLSGLRSTAASAGLDLVYPHKSDDLRLVPDDVPAMRLPTWAHPTRDMVTLAPSSSRLGSSPTTNQPGPLHASAWPAYEPEEGRMRGAVGVIAYRHSPTSPGRYLEAAMHRAGMEVISMDGRLEREAIPREALFVVVVESPFPALEVTGVKTDAPTLFWVHHGEHHLGGNLRLTARYEADAVLLAHSWHLAHRYQVPTHRFPFAAPPTTEFPLSSWSARSFDVAMVGAGIGGEGGRYDRRRELVETLSSAPDITSRFAYGVPPREMLSLYGDSRIVINEGGTRHFPITMRVFEALGCGALLLTEATPGINTLLRRNEHYVALGDDALTQVRSLVASGEAGAIAAAGELWVKSRHTYDHRVDQLVRLAAETEVVDQRPPAFSLNELATMIRDDADVQTIAVFGEEVAAGVDDRAVRPGASGGFRDHSIDAVVIGRGAEDDVADAVRSARGYVYFRLEHQEAVIQALSSNEHEVPMAVGVEWARADLGGSLYRMRPADHPLSS